MTIRRVQLPEHFYLSRATPRGQTAHDVLPWTGAVSYVTDGERLGLEMATGEVRWFQRGRPDDMLPDFRGADLHGLVRKAELYAAGIASLQTIWQDDLQAEPAREAQGGGEG